MTTTPKSEISGAESDVGYSFLPTTRRLDRTYGFFHDSRMQPNISTFATYTSTDGSLLDRPLLERALQRLILEHPRLGTTQIRYDLGKGRSERRAIRLDHVNLNTCLVFVEDPKLTVRDVMNLDKYRTFPPAPPSPHWRVVVLEGRHLILFFNHLGFDGMSTLAFHRNLLAILNDPAIHAAPKIETTTTTANVALTSDQPLSTNLANFEGDVPRILLIPAVLKELVRNAWTELRYRGRDMVFHDAKHGKYSPRTGSEIDDPTAFTPVPRYETVRLPAASMRALMASCKRHDASFTGVLHTAILAVLSSHLYTTAIFAKTRLAVSYRRFTGTDDAAITDEAGNIYWGKRLRALRSILSPANDPAHVRAVLWAESAKYKHHVHDDLADVKKHSRVNGYSKFMGATDAALSRTIGLLGAQRHRTVEISNLGVFAPASTPAGDGAPPMWAITDVSFNVSASHASVGSALTFGAVTLKGGDCVINMSYESSVLDEKAVRVFRDKLEETILGMVEPEGVKSG